MIDISLMSTTDPPNKVTKTLTGLFTTQGVLKSETEMFTPSVTLKTTATVASILSRANYARLRFTSTISRYYFITGIESVTNDVYRVDLKEDVLMNFSAEIKALKCTVARQENVRNGYLVDPEYNALCYKAYVTKAFPNAIANDSLYLITTG